MRPLLFLFFFASALASAIAACSSDSGATNDTADAAEGGSDASHADGNGDASDDAGRDAGPSTCAITRAYVVGCGQDLTCGADKFDSWCDANDKEINSAAFRRAEAQCLTPANCDGTKRRDCEYRSYASATPTTAEIALTLAYCQTCEPADLTGCKARATAYDPDAGPASVGDLFVAVWELADPITDEIRVKCTGSALDAGADAAACAKAFGGCSGDVYIAHLPDCP